DGKILDLGHALLLHVVDQETVEALKSDGFVFKNLRHVIASFIDAGISENQKNSLGIAVDEPDLRFQNCDAGALAAYECTRNVEASVFAGQQMVEVISRNSARNARVSVLYQLGISVAERLELRIEGTFPATLCDLCVKLLFIHRPDRHLRAVVKKD